MKDLSAAHWTAVAMFLGGLAAQIGAMHSWGEVYSPAFISGVLLNVSSVLLAMFSNKPRAGDAQTRADDPPKE